MSLRFALASDVGLHRENNEDSAGTAIDLGLFVVADGMGGHVAGEVASRIAVQAVIEAVRAQAVPRRIRDERRVMANSMIAANLAVVEEAERRGLHGMGTTLTAMRIRSHSVIVSNVGDSRAYALTRTSLRSLTEDHTLVESMIASGEISRSEAFHHPERHVLTQALGTSAAIAPQIVQTRIRPGTRLLLSTDGLHDVVPANEIARVARSEDLDVAVVGLVELANSLGGPDNVTALLIQP